MSLEAPEKAISTINSVRVKLEPYFGKLSTVELPKNLILIQLI
jgi:hypothetical protein